MRTIQIEKAFKNLNEWCNRIDLTANKTSNTDYLYSFNKDNVFSANMITRTQLMKYEYDEISEDFKYIGTKSLVKNFFIEKGFSWERALKSK